jgi:hypothetical protein
LVCLAILIEPSFAEEIHGTAFSQIMSLTQWTSRWNILNCAGRIPPPRHLKIFRRMSGISLNFNGASQPVLPILHHPIHFFAAVHADPGTRSFVLISVPVKT